MKQAARALDRVEKLLAGRTSPRAKPPETPPQEKPRQQTPEPPKRRFPNGDLLCMWGKDRIDMTVCTVRSFRQPAKCRGCRYWKGGNR